jgi:CRISPR-associated endonuclease Cas1
LGSGHATDPKRVAAQLEAKRNGQGLAFARSLIHEKIRNSRDTLTECLPRTPARELAIRRLGGEAAELSKRPPKTVSALLGLEGRAGLAYFNAWQSLPLRWKGVSRHPVPRDWHVVGQRYSFAWKKGESRNATHPVNAILNYAYAILESQVRIQVVAAGFDPTIGFLHSGRGGRSDFVLDLMEPMRPIADRMILELIQAHIFHPVDFTIRSDGVCRLNPDLARLIVRTIAESTWRSQKSPQTYPIPLKRTS